MNSKSNESESWHHIRTTIIALINLIPFFGGALGKLADEYLPNPKQDVIYERLKILEKISDTNYETKPIKEIYGLLPPFANAKMFGRDDKFNRIKEILEFEKNHVFIYGEHGIGKTMLAAKICKVFEKPCLWYSVRTEDVALSKVYGDILQLLEVEDFPNENQVENKIKERIIDNQIKAIFLDNIDSIEIIKKFLSFCNTIEKPLIVTSHCTNINGEFERNNKFKLEIFDDKNIAKELFKAHLPEIELKDDDEEIIDNICKNLDYHPFDIKIVAPQMEFYSSLSDLKEALLDEENAISILKDAKDSNPYLSHYKSLNLTYNNLNEDNQKLFSIIASFPSKSASKSLINYFSELNLNFLKNLIRFSIINIDKENKKYEVHHLTHLFIIEKLKEMEEAKKENNFTNKKVQNMIIKSLMNYIDDNSDWDNPSHRENIRKEKDNILGAMKWCHLSKDVNNLIEFENIMRHYLYVFGEWDERIKWSQKVWDLRNNKYLMDEKGYRILMAGVEGLCFVYLQRGEVEEVNNILDIALKHLPLNTENREWQRVWCFYHRVKGMLNYNKALFEEAKNNFETSIEFAKKSDWETMEIPIGIQLGMPYFEQKKYDDAINVLNSCINHAYEHYERKPQESPPYRRIIRALIWLGKCYCEKGSFEESHKKFIIANELYVDVGQLSEPLLINDLYFEWGLLEKISKNYEIARKLITSIDEDVRYYWSAKKLEKLYKIKEELEIDQ